VLELSGVDAAFVLPDADIDLAVKSTWYGATLNAGQTCMACRRVFVHRTLYEPFVAKLSGLVENASPCRLVLPQQVDHYQRILQDARSRGARVCSATAVCEPPQVCPAAVCDATPDMAICREAVFAPVLAVMSYESIEQAVSMDQFCPYGLTAAIFTREHRGISELASLLRVGAVVVNDVIVPTAHPATPFGGRGRSGWGVTQGEDGLLAMTVPQVVTTRSGTYRPHLQTDQLVSAGHAVRGLLQLSHGRKWSDRVRGLFELVKSGR
jgi:aldehyde dehydrogenase (NAD+)